MAIFIILFWHYCKLSSGDAETQNKILKIFEIPAGKCYTRALKCWEPGYI